MKLNVLDIADDWFQKNRDNLFSSGIDVRCIRTNDSRPKHSIALNLRKESVESD